MNVFKSYRTTLLALAACLVLSPVALLAVRASYTDAPHTVVKQEGRLFAPTAITVPQGARVKFTNEDPFLHQIFVSSPTFSFDSDEQSPGQVIEIAFPKMGDFNVMCGIHPKMSLKVQVQ